VVPLETRFWVFMATKIQVTVFCVVTLCSYVEEYQTVLPPSWSWIWRWHHPPKQWYPTTSPHSVTTQKTVACIFRK